MDYQITLQRAKQREYLVCGETNYTLPIGEIILQIQKFPQQHLVHIADRISSILEADDCSLEQLANIYHEIVDSLSTITWVQDLLCYLPGYSAIQTANVQFERTAFSQDENEKFRIRLSTPATDPSERLSSDKLFSLRNDENHQIGGPGLNWQYWRQFLLGKFNSGNCYLLSGMEAGMTSAGKKQFAELRRMLLEILKLQVALETCLVEIEAPDDQIDKILKYAGLSVGLQDIHTTEITGVSIRSSTYHCYSLSGLVALEYSFMRSSQSRIKTCKLCGRPFASCSSRHRFCSQQNPDFDGMPCDKVGPTISHRKGTDNDDILKAYEKIIVHIIDGSKLPKISFWRGLSHMKGLPVKKLYLKSRISLKNGV